LLHDIRCFVSPNNRLAYLTIHKNASTFTIKNLTNHSWAECAVQDVPLTTTIFVILREDIITRWVSGIATYLMPTIDCKEIDTMLNHTLISNIFDNIVFDDMHTIKQVDFVKQIKKPHCIKFLKLQTDFYLTLQHLLCEYGMDYNITLHKINDTKHKCYNEKKLFDFIKSHALLPHYNKKLVEFFKDDYELIENTTFHNI